MTLSIRHRPAAQARPDRHFRANPERGLSGVDPYARVTMEKLKSIMQSRSDVIHLSTRSRMTWNETLDYLETLSKRGMKPGLERMLYLMSVLGHPERRFKSIHVAGTNGKGSTCAMLESVFRSSGIISGLYTSPHLTDIRERITVGGRRIDRDSFAYWAGRIRDNAGPIEPDLTYFEIFTAIALCFFAGQNVEVAVIEVGMGGRLDATNVLPSPDACLVTDITLEHTEHLGKTVSEIAREKAGIVKKDSVCLTTATGEALKSIHAACGKIESRPVIVGPRMKPSWNGLAKICALKGDFQRKNIHLVLKTIEVLRSKGWEIPERSVRKGLKEVVWPGRYQWKTAALGSRRVPVLLDAAHNPGAMKELVRCIRKTRFKDRNCILVFNALRDKDLPGMIRPLVANLKIDRVLIPRLSTERSSEPNAVGEVFKRESRGIVTEYFESVSGLRSFLKKRLENRSNVWVLATGSLYLIGAMNQETHS